MNDKYNGDHATAPCPYCERGEVGKDLLQHTMGIKEQLAMVCEQFGDVRVVSVDVTQVPSQSQQLSMWAAQRGYKEAAMRRR